MPVATPSPLTTAGLNKGRAWQSLLLKRARLGQVDSSLRQELAELALPCSSVTAFGYYY